MARRDLVIKKVTPSQIAALYKAHKWLKEHWECENDLDFMLSFHLELFLTVFEKKMNSDQATHSLKFSELEAFAFWNLWKSVDLRLIDYSGLTVQSYFDKVDKFRHGFIAQYIGQ